MYVVLIAILLTFLPVTPSLWAATYYMGTSGSDANSCATAQNSGTRKRTFASASTCLSPGDTLIVGDGTYTEIMNISVSLNAGTSSNRITIQAENRRQATFAPGGASTRALTLLRSYYTVEGFVFNCTSTASGDNTACFSNNVTSGINNVWLIDNEFYNSQGGGGYAGGGSSGWIIEYNTIHDNGWATDYHQSNGLYFPSLVNSIIRRNEFYHNECVAIRFGNSSTTGGDSTDNIAEYNYIHDNGDGFGGVEDCTSEGAAILLAGSRNVARYNLIKNQWRYGLLFYSFSPHVETDNSAYNNTVYNASFYCIDTRTNVFNSTAKNNHLAACGLGATRDTGTGTVYSNNRTTGTITDCTVSTSDFTQKAGSSCIDAGVDVGLSYNGSAPDIGAFETFVFSSCEVPNSAASTIQITFTSNTNVLGSTLTTFTARRNGSNNALTGAATKIGDNIVSLPLTTTYVGGDTADISWASGGLTDSALIGGSLNQPYVQTLTNQSCTNNSGSAPTFTLTQVTHEYHGVYGLEASPDIRSAEGVSTYSVIAGGAFRIRYAITCGGANCDSTGFYVYYATGGGYAAVPDTFGAGNVAFCGSTFVDPLIPSNGSSTTNQLSTGGTFVPGGIVFSANAIPTISGLNNGYKTELEYCIRFDTDASGTYTFRLYNQTGSALDTYTITPSVVIASPQSSGSF